MGVKFGGFARERRIAERVQLKAVAEAMGFSSAYVSDIEQGFRNPPSQDKLTIWATALGVDPEEFILLAEMDRPYLELPLAGEAEEAELALALARRWGALTSAQRKALLTVLEPSGGNRNE